ncbi:hypothetical protein CWE13_07970 [Aliidiomarina shirensis]|uniref:Uncharacterized protein n=1 Tax=Aliidiomarina shirensis TaxID=1048642 RepID=A0A432WSQ1_9GAMM|nr:hypothetical protein [Aliidiomarina shirensis]RUO36778.1 hypothetical protein CWE13_07970 [Aliidiomarina shirensis]
MKAILWLVIVAIIITVFYLTNNYESSLRIGDKHGLTIGDAKLEAYKKLPSFLSEYKSRGDRIFIVVKVTESASGYLATDPDFMILVEPLFNFSGEAEFMQEDTWTFYINGSYLDVIKLRFEDDKLIEIFRRKRFFELPVVAD